ncbi:MAG: 6-carboxytetrahydropterin synthase QueD [Candidatus Niyogibacteria bacterium]|nr:6-carboxytetrahydropterin synthase QueD [Candidatus Niyogibacteria bacterium]
MSVSKIFTFEAAHQLPNHKGKCARLHGHSYRFEVTVSGPIQQEGGSSEGMVIDFADLSNIVEREILQPWDHQFLNDLVPYVTTAENLAVDIFNKLKRSGIPIKRVCLWETAQASATVEE